MKDHEIKQLVSDLTEIAIKYHDCNQLRENIAIRVRESLKTPISDESFLSKRFTIATEMVKTKAGALKLLQSAGILDKDGNHTEPYK